MGCGRLFHLNLHLAVGRVHVVELLHARGSGVLLLLSIESLVDVEYLSVTAQEQSQGIESGVVIVVLASLHGKRVEQRCLHQPQRSEVEVIADTTYLIINHRVILALATDDVVMIGIHHRRIAIRCHTENALQGALAQQQLAGLRLQQCILGIGVLGYTHHGVAAAQVVNQYLLTILETLRILSRQQLSDE